MVRLVSYIGPVATILLATLGDLGCNSAPSKPSASGRDAAAIPAVARDAAAPVPPPPQPDAGPATRDIRPALETFLTRLGKREVTAIWDDAHEAFRAREVRGRSARMMELLVEPLGGFREIIEYRAQAGDQRDDNVAIGTARFERGVAPYRVSFRDDHDQPRLLFFSLDIPDELEVHETVEQARVVAERAGAALISGDLNNFRPHTHPVLDEKLDEAQAKELKALTGKLGGHKRFEILGQDKCKGQCFTLKLIGDKNSANAKLRMVKLYGRWRILSFDLQVI